MKFKVQRLLDEDPEFKKAFEALDKAPQKVRFVTPDDLSLFLAPQAIAQLQGSATYQASHGTTTLPIPGAFVLVNINASPSALQAHSAQRQYSVTAVMLVGHEIQHARFAVQPTLANALIRPDTKAGSLESSEPPDSSHRAQQCGASDYC